MGLEGIVSKRKDSPYRSGRSPDWLKMKYPAAPAVKREEEEEWGKKKWRTNRARYFGDCPEFVGKIVLRERIVWFQRSDGIREAPKENSAWFLWERSPLRIRRQPVILYAPARSCSSSAENIF
jgi:hypothetical protein